MKIWDAILIGCKETDQAFGHYFAYGKKYERQACAAGAAIIAAGFHFGELLGVNKVEKLFPEMKASFDCPLCVESYKGDGIILHLNDDHKATREFIAFYLRDRLYGTPQLHTAEDEENTQAVVLS